MIRVNPLSNTVKLPEKISNNTFNIFADYSYVIPPRTGRSIITNLKVRAPIGSLIEVKATEDSPLFGQLVVFESAILATCQTLLRIEVFNHSLETCIINSGEIIAKFVCYPIYPYTATDYNICPINCILHDITNQFLNIELN
jgi:hypothetical protein